MDTRQKFGQFLDQHDVVTVVGAHDALSAKLIEEAGFPAVWASGFGIAYAQQFRPDANIVTMVENAAAASHMVDAVSIPVIADIDNGYGNAINVKRTIRQYIQSGVSAVALEDQTFPKRCGIYPGYSDRSIISVKEMVGKLKMARDTAQNELFLIARTDAFNTGHTVEVVLERAYAYVEAGADSVFAISSDVDDLKSFASKWDLPNVPLTVVPTLMPNHTINDFREMGFRIVIFSAHVLQAAITGMQTLLANLKERGEFGTSQDAGQMIPFSEFVNLIGLQELGDVEERYCVS
jgi:phosphoenolpyruvate phosphomutase